MAPPAALRHETARSRAIAHFAAYWLFLLFILAAVFTPRYTRHFYRQTAAVREPLLRNELLENVFLPDAMSAEQVYLALERLLVPHAFQDRYYAGLVPASVDAGGRYGRGRVFSRDDKTLKYRPRYTSLSLLALGRVRLRQLRVRARDASCRAPGFLDAFYATHAGANATARCFARYSAPAQDAGDVALRDPAGGDPIVLEYRDYSDGRGWASPFSKVAYGPGGQVWDLRAGARAAREDLRRLRRAGFLDNATRALFADMSWYNPNVDMFTHLTLAFEFLPAGKVRPSAIGDSAPLLHDARALEGRRPYAPRDRAAVLLEFCLYAISFWYLVRVTEDVTDYASLKAYFAVGWNVADVASVACFVAALVLRIVTLLKTMTGHVNAFGEDVAADQHADLGRASFDTYVRLRLTFQYYRYGRNFLAAGILVNFVKAFKFLSVSRQLSQFTRTIYRVAAEMLNVLLILAIVLAGFAIAFHVLLGHAIARYRTFPDAATTLLLVVFGDFDLEEIIRFAPLLGVALMLAYVVIMTFILLTMLLKIVDVSYGEVLDGLADGGGDDLARDLRLALYRVAYDAYWTVQIRCTLCRARGAPAGPARPPGAHAQIPPGAGPRPPGPSAPPGSDVPCDQAASDGRSDLRRALAKREAHLRKRSRAFDPDAERRLLVDHFIREGRDVSEGDVAASDVGDQFAKVLGQQAALAELSGKFAGVS